MTISRRRRSPILSLAAIVAITLMVSCGSGGDDDDLATSVSSGTESTASSGQGADVTTAGTSAPVPGADYQAGDDVCALLTDEEVAEFLGGEVTHSDFDDETDASGPRCDWIRPDLPGSGVVSITLFTEFDLGRLEGIISSDPDNVALRDIGEGARVSDGLAEVDVGDTGFMLQVAPFSALDIASIEALAAAAADRL